MQSFYPCYPWLKNSVMPNQTNDSKLKSWVQVSSDSDFPIQNLPFGVFKRRETNDAPRVGVAIGEMVLDLGALHAAGQFDGTPLAGKNVFARDCLNDFLALGRGAWSGTRNRVSLLLSEGNPALRDDAKLREKALVSQRDAELLLPIRVGDYSDFYASINHASNVGSMFRDPANPLLPNWKHLPVGYHGRASSIVVSGVDVVRPGGQLKPKEGAPVFAPSQEMDFELEMGFITGQGNKLGSPIPIREVPQHIFGMVLLNDWSARDIQRWEYQPLGPFLAKSFATSISPWVVSLDALEPFRVAGEKQDPPVLPYLQQDGDWHFDIKLEVLLQTAQMSEPMRISNSNARNLYWSIVQMLAHQTSNGCNVGAGDICGTGTISGAAEDSRGCLLELCWHKTKPLQLPSGETRAYLEDGDTVIMRGWCQGEGYRVGFGECRAKVQSAMM